MKRFIKLISKRGLIPLCVTLLMVGMTSCDKSEKRGNEKWEYKIIKISGTSTYYNEDFGAYTFPDPTSQLNTLGKDGWELVSSYTEIETAHPNFGNKEYVTGLQPNTRTHIVNLVLKRRLPNDKK